MRMNLKEITINKNSVDSAQDRDYWRTGYEYEIKTSGSISHGVISYRNM